MAILVITRWYIYCIAFSGQIRLQFDLASPSSLEGEGPIHLETTTQPFFKPQKKWLVLFTLLDFMTSITDILKDPQWLSYFWNPRNDHIVDIFHYSPMLLGIVSPPFCWLNSPQCPEWFQHNIPIISLLSLYKFDIGPPSTLKNVVTITHYDSGHLPQFSVYLEGLSICWMWGNRTTYFIPLLYYIVHRVTISYMIHSMIVDYR